MTSIYGVPVGIVYQGCSGVAITVKADATVIVAQRFLEMLLAGYATSLIVSFTGTVARMASPDLRSEVAGAKILVSAVGRAGLIQGEWIQPGAIVIDVGISRDSTGVRGDVEFETARQRAGFITPVPGGVGSMTVAMLTRNTLIAAEQITMQAS